VKVAFTKMNAAGNDFVVIDNRDGDVKMTGEQIAHACDRRRGVGADGLILIVDSPGYDFFMRFYNADGTEAEMCGNGARCSAVFAVGMGLGKKRPDGVDVRFLTGSGAIEALVTERGEGGGRHFGVEMRMMDAREMRLDIPVQVAQTQMNVHFVIVGTRHAVVPVDDARFLTSSEINELGRVVRHNDAFGPVGANVNFVSLDQRGRIHIRTYEKGVEAETHACGTGSVAAGVVFAHQGRCRSPVTIVQRGGDELHARFALQSGGANQVVLDGPADVNFAGTLEF
jgi:diaminopimelate epimerase